MLVAIGLAICIYGICRLLQAALIESERLKKTANGNWYMPVWVVTLVGVLILGILAIVIAHKDSSINRAFFNQ